MALQITAKLVQLMPVETGNGKNGQWKKQNIIVETADSQYPKKICVSVWGDKMPEGLQIGQQLKVSFDVESREFNGKWYTDVKAWKVETASGSSSSSSEMHYEPDSYSHDEPPF